MDLYFKEIEKNKSLVAMELVDWVCRYRYHSLFCMVGTYRHESLFCMVGTKFC